MKDDLKAQYGYSDEAVSLLLTRGGLSIYTCVDPDVQAQVEQIYSDRTNLDYTSSSGQQLQSAIVVIDNATGNVAALSGGMGRRLALARALACGGALGGLLALAGLLWAVPLARLLGAEGAILGARASYIAGCSATACTMACLLYTSPSPRD